MMRNLRLCMSERGLNNITIKDKYPLFPINELLEQLQGLNYYSKIGFETKVLRVRIWREGIPKITFNLRSEYYKLW